MDLREKRSFKIKKWTLFGICLAYIVINILLMLISGYVADYYFNEYANSQKQSSISSGRDTYPKDTEDVNPEDFKNIVKIFILMVAFLAIIVDLFGIIGVYKEHYCLTLTFAIILSIGTFFNIVSFLLTSKNGSVCLVNICVTVLAFTFARDISKSRSQMAAYPMVIIQTTHPQQTVIPMYVTDGQQQYNPAYGPPPNYSSVPYVAAQTHDDYPMKST